MPSQIPERQPIGDAVYGHIIQIGDDFILSTTPLAGAHVYASGDFVVRYAVELLGKPHQALVPGMVVLDRGQILTGEPAWDFLINRSNLHPRADVLGYLNDGEDEMLFVKQLDLAKPILVLVYAGGEAVVPLCQVKALITLDESGYPERLLGYLPSFSSIESWQAANND